MNLDGKVYVVTGASRGFGRAVAHGLAAEGAPLALCARGRSQLQTTADEIRSKYAVPLFVAALDVCDAGAVGDFARESRQALGPAYALVNNAAVLGPVGRIDTVDLDGWRRALDVNVAGVANLCAAFVPQMIEFGRGSILNVSGGGMGGPDVPGRISAYTTAKGAVAVLTETLAKELAPANIRVNAIAPGSMATGFLRTVVEAGPAAAGDVLYEEAKSGAGAEDDTFELGEGVASLVRYLLSDESDWLTGKLVSARWERVEDLKANEDKLASTSLLTLRRIDDTLYREIDEPA